MGGRKERRKEGREKGRKEDNEERKPESNITPISQPTQGWCRPSRPRDTRVEGWWANNVICSICTNMSFPNWESNSIFFP